MSFYNTYFPLRMLRALLKCCKTFLLAVSRPGQSKDYFDACGQYQYSYGDLPT
jgi:hypothetical protein